MTPLPQFKTKTMSDIIKVKQSTEDRGAVGKPAVRRSAFDEVRECDKEQLRTLLKEVKEMDMLDAPRYFGQSNKMKQLFELEKAYYCTWATQFSSVQRAIEVEILWRVINDAW